MSHFLLAAILLASVTGGAKSVGGNVHITVVSCAADAHVAPTIKLIGHTTGRGDDSTTTTAATVPVEGTPGVYSAELTVPSGLYFAAVDGQRCKSPATTAFSVFPGHARHEYIVTTTFCCSLLELGSAAVGVRVPDGVGVTILTKQGASPRFKGVRDEDVTYFDAILPGKYILMLSTVYAAACIPISVGFLERQFFDFGVAEVASKLREASARTNHGTCTG